MLILKRFDVTRQICSLVTLPSTITVKWVYLHCTIAMSNVHWTSLSPNLSLKVVFLFQSFLVITVCNKLRNNFVGIKSFQKYFSYCLVSTEMWLMLLWTKSAQLFPLKKKNGAFTFILRIWYSHSLEFGAGLWIF